MNDFYALAVILAIGWIVLAYFIMTRPWGYRSHSRQRTLYRRMPFVRSASNAFDISDVGQQLHAVMAASFEARQLLNWGEYQTFKVVEAEVAAMRQGYRVYPQTSLGEVLYSSDSNAFRSINSKRVDILIVDRAGWPIVAVEYQGDGHYQGTAAARDAVKKEALRKAGIRYIEISASHGPEQIRSRVRGELFLPAGEMVADRARKTA